MLSASSTRDLNLAARAAEKFLQELGFELPHAKALDLVARLVGKPHHMAAQAALPKTAAASQLPVSVTDAVRQVVFSASTVPDSQGRVLVAKADLETLYHATNDAVVEAKASPSAKDPDLVPKMTAAIEDLCKVLTHRDVEQALYDQGISDAANAALVLAVPYVKDQVLADFSLDALQAAYDDLPCSVDAEVFSEGHGNWSLSEAEYRLAKRLADALYAGKRQRAEELSSQDQERLCAQFELATGESALHLRHILTTKTNLHDEVLRLVKQEFDVDLSLGPWVLANDSEKGFWCNGFGWTTSRMAATGYPEAMAQGTTVQDLSAKFGSYTRWVRFGDAFDYVSGDDQG